ncbi:MAG: hypothetical protein WKF73_15230 [Nocardioidaceae bacterium]
MRPAADGEPLFGGLVAAGAQAIAHTPGRRTARRVFPGLHLRRRPPTLHCGGSTGPRQRGGLQAGPTPLVGARRRTGGSGSCLERKCSPPWSR